MLKELLVLISMVILAIVLIVLSVLAIKYDILVGVIAMLISGFIFCTYIWCCMVIFGGDE